MKKHFFLAVKPAKFCPVLLYNTPGYTNTIQSFKAYI
jgi:hypothetical protein